MMEKIHNLKLFGLVAILTVALVFIGVDFIDSQVKTQGKPDKPFQPGKPGKERIIFYEDLEGDQVVEGCCPNAGPWPEYTMTLGFDFGDFGAGTPINGWLFINRYGAGRDQKYKVQFWWDYENDLGIEIIGGVIDQDKKTKILTVTFTNEECVSIKEKDWITDVNFTLIRHESD